MSLMGGIFRFEHDVYFKSVYFFVQFRAVSRLFEAFEWLEFGGYCRSIYKILNGDVLAVSVLVYNMLISSNF